VSGLTKAQEVQFRTALTPRLTQYIPHTPTPPQAAFLLLPHKEAFYGGAAGGGKSDALLMGALQYVDIQGYSAILFRKTYSDLSLPGALMDRAEDWLAGTDAKWSDKDKRWTFPSGATVTFGYLEHENDKLRYQSAEFNFIGFDELTQFSETQYRYLFSRLRREAGSEVPSRMRSAANPGGPGHEWVRQRFIIEGRSSGRIFIPAKLQDNPHLDADDYKDSLGELDLVTKQQLLEGDWGAKPQGHAFKRENFEIVDQPPENKSPLRVVRYWDCAATEGRQNSKSGSWEPSWTVGTKLSLHEDGFYYVEDVRRKQLGPGGVERLVQTTAAVDGRYRVSIYMEQEPGSAGKVVIDYYRRHILQGFTFRADKVTGSKADRARPVISASEAHLIKVVRGPWINAWLDELEAWPTIEAQDQVDSLSGAFTYASRRRVIQGGRKRRLGIFD
jgi:predicted phage terminase large subunit-like protein